MSVHPTLKITFLLVKGTVNGVRTTCYIVLPPLNTAAVYNLGSGSWLARASGTVAHYAAIYCIVSVNWI